MKRILVIEDESAICHLITRYLQAEGYEVMQAHDGLTGRNLALQMRPDLIVCDVVMPGLSGYGVLDAVRQHAATIHTPFLFLSARSTKADIRTGIGLGADNYLTKPFTKEQLLGAVAARLASRDRLEATVVETMPTALGRSSNKWLLDNAIAPQLQITYSGWFVAYEPKSGACFLGETQDAAYRAACRVFPDGIFFYQQLNSMEDKSSPSRMPAKSTTSAVA
jgi:DNA-binding response OmpR family regulator